jgi:Carboxypeptidase regulatory-like domain
VTTGGINAALVAGGAIHGTVTDAADGHHGLANVWVSVNSPSTGYGSGTQTGDDGSYTVIVPPGTDYQVCFWANGATGGSSDTSGYLAQCYLNQPPSGTPTPVSVTTGVATGGINAALVAGGAIHGTVTDAADGHHGLANVNVSVSSPSIGGDYATTAADGSYTVTGLPAGTDYTVCFDASGATGGSSDTHGYVNQCYNNQPQGTPTPVSVTTGATTPGINAALVAGGSIHGTVTDAGTHQGLGNIWAYVSSPSTGASGVAATGADGSYTVTGLPAGTDYQVCFEGYGPMGGGSGPPWYLGQCYNNQPQGTPTPVGVTVGATTPGIDAALVAGGSIHGTVTDARGPLQGPGEGVNVSVHSPSTGYSWGTQVPLGFDFGVNVPAGTDYQVCFSAPGFVDQCYNNQPVGTPTPVSVTTGEATGGINAALVAGTSIAGAVPYVGGTPHVLAVPKRLAAGGWLQPHAVSPHRMVLRPPTVSSAYRAGFRVEALWIREVRIHRLSVGLIRARIGSR